MLIAHWKAGAKPSQRAWRNKMAVLGPGDADLEWRGVANRLPGYRIWSLNSTSLSITGSGAWIPSDCTEQWRSVRTHTSSRRAYPLHRRVDVCSPASSASFCPGLSSTVPPSSCTSCVSVIFLTSRPSSHIHSSAFPLAQAPGSLLYRQGPYHCSLPSLLSFRTWFASYLMAAHTEKKLEFWQPSGTFHNLLCPFLFDLLPLLPEWAASSEAFTKFVKCQYPCL